MMALSSTGDLVLLAVLVGLAGYDLASGGVAVVAVASGVIRWGTTSLASLAGAQAVVGAAGWTGSAAEVASSWLAAGALVVACPGPGPHRPGDGPETSFVGGIAPAVACGAVAAQLVAGAALSSSPSPGAVAVRVVAPVAGAALALACGRLLPRSAALVAGGAASAGAVVLAIAAR